MRANFEKYRMPKKTAADFDSSVLDKEKLQSTTRDGLVDVADVIANEKKKGISRFILPIIVFVILLSIVISLLNDMAFRCRFYLRFNNEKLENVADFVYGSEELYHLSGKKSNAGYYGNYDFPSDVEKNVVKYFSDYPDGLINCITGAGGKRWNLPMVSEDVKAVFFFIGGQDNGDNINVYGREHKSYYICNSNLDIDSLSEILSQDKLTVYDISSMRDNWYMVLRTCFDESRLPDTSSAQNKV